MSQAQATSSNKTKLTSTWLDAWMRWATFHSVAYGLIALGAALLVTVALSWLLPQTFLAFDERSDSLTWNLNSKGFDERRVVMVDIDEKSIQALGPWPWSRETMASLVGGLNNYGVGLKLFDVVLPDAKTGDDAFTRVLQSGGPSIGGQILSLDPKIDVKSGALPLGAFDAVSPCSASMQPGFGYIGNDPSILSAYSGVGHLTPLIDPDGMVRRIPAFVCVDGRGYPALSLAALMHMGLGSEDALMKSGPYWVKGQFLGQAPWTLKLKSAPEFELPLDERGFIRVSYRTPKAGFVSISALDVIRGDAPKTLLDGAWVLVGSTAFGAGDAVPTPHGGAEGGLEVHAQVISAALDEATPYMPLGNSGIQIVSVLAGVLLLLLLVNGFVGLGGFLGGLLGGLFGVSQASKLFEARRQSAQAWSKRERVAFLLPFFGLALAGLLYAAHAWALLSHGYWISWSLPATGVVLSSMALTAAVMAQLRWQRTRVYDNMSSYLSEPVAAEVALQEASQDVQVKESAVVILSINLRNFDRFCASQAPDLSAKLLHQYLFFMNREVKNLGGQLQHIQGSELLVVWSDELDQDAIEQIAMLPKTLWQCSQDWLQIWSLQQTEELRLEKSSANGDLNTSAKGLVPTSYISDSIRLGRELQLEMGLELGQAMLGSMGPSDRRVHAVIGEPVQVAHALRAMSSELSYPALMGPSLHDRLELNSKVISGTDSPTRLGDFLLPGLTTSRLIYACSIKVEPTRLYLVDTESLEQRLA